MKKIIIIGLSGHAAEIRDYINHYNDAKPAESLEVIGFINDNDKTYDHYEFKEPFISTIDEHEVQEDAYYIMGIANPKWKKPIIDRLVAKGAKFTGLIHPAAMISPTAEIGETTVISHNTSVGPKAKIGEFNIINSRCTIGHDTKIGDFNNLSPQVVITGKTVIGNDNLFGTNACTIPSTVIGNSNKIMAGMVVNKNVGDGETVFYRYKERLVVQRPV